MHPLLVPTADIFQTGNELFADFAKFCIWGAAAAIGWFLLKELFKIKTFMAGVIAIAAAIGLGWGVEQTQNKDIGDSLSETLQTSTNGGSGGGAQAPAKKKG